MRYGQKPSIAALALSIMLALNSTQVLAQAQGTPPPPTVDVLTVAPQTVVLTENLPARLEASREAVIVPRVSGIVQERLFQEGAFVRTGEVLYRLDSGTFDAALNTAKAGLGQAKAALGQAQASRDLYRATVNRYAPLVKANAVSRQTYDEAKANLQVQESNIAAAQAGIAAAQANIESAQINLSYTEIKSPISGVIGRSAVTEGAYVVASQSQMAEVRQLNPLYVNITQSAGTLMNLRRNLQSGAVQSGGTNEIEILLEDGSTYAHKGRLLFVNQTVDQNTGEISIRAEVPNPEGDLLPGLYVRVSVPQSSMNHAYLLPQQAVTRGATDTVLVVNEDGSFRPQAVKIAGQQGSSWIVSEGLESGMKVIVEGQAKLMMGAKSVQTREWGSTDKQQEAAPAADAAPTKNTQAAEAGEPAAQAVSGGSLPKARDLSAEQGKE